VEYNGTSVTDLNIDNFTVDIGIQLALINNISYNETTAYYSLNITVPSNPEGSKQDIWVNLSYKGIWKTDINIEAVWYYAPPTTTTPTPTPSGPGPGPGPAPPRVSNFIVDKDLIKIELKPGETDKQSVKIYNIGRTKLTITGRIQYLDEFSFFTGTGTEYTLELSPDETEELEVNFIIKKDQGPGVYPGKIVFTADQIERTVLVVVEIESEKPLFDVKVEVLPEYRVVYPGDKVMAQLTLYNLGRTGRVDADVEYGIKSLDGTVMTSEREAIAVETQLSTIKSLNLPPSIRPDSYVFYSKVTYDDIVGTGSSMFSVVEKFKLNLFLLGLLILVIIIILIILFIYFFKRRKKKKKKRKSKKSRKRKK